MNPVQWRVLGELFDEALLVPSGERIAWAENAAGDDVELLSELNALLLSHDEASGKFVQERIQDAVVLFHHFNSNEAQAERRVGPYRLVRELGSGGMGIVYLAERVDEEYSAQVAIKLVRPGMDTAFLVSRFRRERQTLARLEHPNIARLLDGGTTEQGLPYLVMEYVEGASITQYVRRSDLSLRRTLEMFLHICDAVEYAHRNFVIHRDIKPGNILIDGNGVPKLLDFGICKLLKSEGQAESETTIQLVTPDYGSPEQVWGEAITLQSDVYSLGAVLYETLTDILPQGPAIHSTPLGRRRLAEREVIAPSVATIDKARGRALRGDLDTILLRAMERNPAQRYQSAAQLAGDIRRYLDSEPIHAKPPTAVYRLRKFVVRHRALVVGTASVLVALSLGLALSIRQTRTADRRLLEVQDLAGRLIFDVHDSIQDLPGSTRARALVIKTGTDALDRVRASVRGDTRALSDLAFAYQRLGDVQGNTNASNLGDVAAASTSYQKALELLDGVLAARPHDGRAQTARMAVYGRLARLQMTNGRLQESAATVQKGLCLGKLFLPQGGIAFQQAMADLYGDAAEEERNRREYKPSLEDAQESLRIASGIAATGKKSSELTQTFAAAYASIGMAEANLEKLTDAEAHYRKSIAETEQLVAAAPDSVTAKRQLMLAYGHLADVSGNQAMHNLGNRPAALAGYRRAAEIAGELYAADAADQRAASDYGIVLSRVETVMNDGDIDGRMQVQSQSLDILRQAAKINPRSAVLRLYQGLESDHLGNSYAAKKDFLQASNCYRDAIEFVNPGRLTNDLSALMLFISSHEKLATSEVRLGHRVEALRSAEAAVGSLPGPSFTQAQRLILPRTYAAIGRTYAALATSPLRRGADRAEAHQWLEKSVSAWRAVEHDPSFGSAHRMEMASVGTLLKHFSAE